MHSQDGSSLPVDCELCFAPHLPALHPLPFLCQRLNGLPWLLSIHQGSSSMGEPGFTKSMSTVVYCSMTRSADKVPREVSGSISGPARPSHCSCCRQCFHSLCPFSTSDTFVMVVRVEYDDHRRMGNRKAQSFASPCKGVWWLFRWS